jgi:hypothetical protein
MKYLRQATASQEILLGPFVDSTDGDTEETGLTIAASDIEIYKSGSTTHVDKASGGATHSSKGMYSAVLDASDTDTIGAGRIFVHVAGALPVLFDFCVLDEAVFDVMFGTSAPSTLAAGALMGLADDAITASKIAAGAIGASEAPLLGDINTDVETIVGRVLGTLAAGTHNPQSGDAFTRLGAPAGASLAADLLAIDNLVDDLESRLTATRAGYLDNLAEVTAARMGALTDWLDGGRLDLILDGRLAAASYTAPLDAAATRAAIGLAAADLDDQLATMTPALMATAVLAGVVEGSVSVQAALRLMLAVLAGEVSGAPSGPIVFRDTGDTTNRVTATIDAHGNRTDVTLNAS